MDELGENEDRFELFVYHFHMRAYLHGLEKASFDSSEFEN